MVLVKREAGVLFVCGVCPSMRPLLDLQESMMFRLLIASMLSFFKTLGFSVRMAFEVDSDFLCKNMAEDDDDDGFLSLSFDKGGGEVLP